MPEKKLISLSDAIDRYMPDNSSVVMGASLESVIPFAAGHEIMRRGRRNLTLIGPIADILVDQLIGAGCVRKVQAAWVGNVITGSGYNFRRAVENGRLVTEDHTNFTISLALRAAAMGVPFLPTRTALGSDLFATNPGLTLGTCPFTGEPVTAVRAVEPDAAIVHVQRSDIYGNAHAWGNPGITREACLAARRIILTTEEIVDTGIITRDPNRVVAPGFRVSAVVHTPWGAHPSPVPGHYNRDHQAFLDYREASRTPEGFAQWKARWVDGVGSPADYTGLLGPERMARLAIKAHVYSERVDYGC